MTHSLEPSSFGSFDSAPKAVWRWRFEDASGREIPGDSVSAGSPHFPSQSDAESWVGEVWRELLEEGIDAVTLFEGDRQVYGPMSLHSA
jgi:hypothetical protein